MGKFTGLARIIPALAGNTMMEVHPFSMSRDHPRSRGEYSSPCGTSCGGGGSSPLSRGIPRYVLVKVGRYGIIPALAGNTRSLLRRGVGGGGSSPLSRGIPPWRRRCWTSRRIIPALAGNTALWRCKNCGSRDHPRSRGEYEADGCYDVVGDGSSPLSRGILACVHHGDAVVRIIPALAGNTLWGGHEGPARRDHPRSRGEYSC